MANRKDVEDGASLMDRTVWIVPLTDVRGRPSGKQALVKEKQHDGKFRLRLDVYGRTSDGQEKLVIQEYITGLTAHVLEHYLMLTQDIDREIGQHVESIIDKLREPAVAG